MPGHPSYLRVTCTKCGAECAMHPDSRRVVAANGMAVVCVGCGLALVRSDTRTACGGGIVNGRLEPDLRKALMSTELEERRN